MTTHNTVRDNDFPPGLNYSPTADAALAERYTLLHGYLSVRRAAVVLGVGDKRLEGALRRTGTALKVPPPVEPPTVPARDAWPLPAGHPISWGAIAPGVPWPRDVA